MSNKNLITSRVAGKPTRTISSARSVMHILRNGTALKRVIHQVSASLTHVLPSLTCKKGLHQHERDQWHTHKVDTYRPALAQ